MELWQLAWIGILRTIMTGIVSPTKQMAVVAYSSLHDRKKGSVEEVEVLNGVGWHQTYKPATRSRPNLAMYHLWEVVRFHVSLSAGMWEC